MSKNILEAIRKEAGELEQVRANCAERLQALTGGNGEKFDFTKPIPEVEQSIGDIDARVLGLIGLATGLNSEMDLNLVPKGFVNGVDSQFSRLTKEYRALKSHLDGLDRDGGVGNLDQNSFSVQSSNGEINIELRDYFQQIQESVESALISYYRLASILKGMAFYDFSAAFREFSRQFSEVQKTQANLSQLVADEKCLKRKFSLSVNREMSLKKN